MSFAFVPFYLRLLGIEAYGLIGFFAALMGAFAVLDLGLGITVNRELSRLSVQGSGAADAGDLLRTFEAAYWAVALAIGLGTTLAAPAIVDGWLNLDRVPRDQAVAAVQLMGATALMRWPVSLYVGALSGMQQQVRMNAVTAAASTVAGLGAVAALSWAAPTLPVFFGWQVLVTAAQVAVLRHLAWRSLGPRNRRPRATLAGFRSSWRFSAGVTGITLLSVILTQLDKFVLSRLLPLDQFGRYALAGAVAAVLTAIGTAVESAAFPALARLVAAGDADGERRLYHGASQGLAALIVPATVALVLFAPELLHAYLGDAVVAASAGRFLSVLAAGSGILALMVMPLSLQLANGWTALSVAKNVAAVTAYVPLTYLLARQFGAIGAAWAWLALTAGYLLIEVPVMHRRLLPGAQWRWYLRDVGVPALVSLAVLGTLRLVLPAGARPGAAATMVAGAALLALAGSVAILPGVREFVAGRLGSFGRMK